MQLYLRILISIIAALVSLATLISIVSMIEGAITGDQAVFSDPFFPFVIAMMGFVMFGLTGSLFWASFLRALNKLLIGGPMLRHALSVSLSVVFSWLVLSLPLVGIRDIPRMAGLLVFIVPVAGTSLLWYWLLYERPKRKEPDRRPRF